MPLPGDHVPARPADFVRRIAALERTVQRLAAGRSLENATIDNGPGKGIRSSDFDGTGFANPGTTGVYVGGDGIVANRIFFQPNSIPNDWLTNPVVPQGVWKGTTANFGLNTGWTTLVTQDLTVPSDATGAQIFGFVRLVATNSTASKDYLYSNFAIGDQSCGGFSTPVDAGDAGTSFCAFERVYDGTLTPGSTITLAASGSTGLATWASGNNICQMAVNVQFFR